MEVQTTEYGLLKRASNGLDPSDEGMLRPWDAKKAQRLDGQMGQESDGHDGFTQSHPGRQTSKRIGQTTMKAAKDAKRLQKTL